MSFFGTSQALSGKDFPRVLEGDGFGIIEDCGGIGGLKEIEKAFKKKSGTSYKEYCEKQIKGQTSNTKNNKSPPLASYARLLPKSSGRTSQEVRELKPFTL